MATMTNEQKKAEGVLPLEEDELEQATGGVPPGYIGVTPPPPPKGVV
jgi:hypothetical protein